MLSYRKFILANSALGSLFLVYMLMLIPRVDYWGNIMSALSTFAAAIMIFTLSRRFGSLYKSWFFMSMACLSWAITDGLWVYFEIALRQNPDDLPLFMVLYLLPNIFIALGVGSFFMLRSKNWNAIQMMLNVMTTLMVGISLIWILFFNQQFSLLLFMNVDSVSVFLYMLTDMFSLSAIFVLYVSTRVKKLYMSYKLVILGVVMYSMADMYYAYLIFNDLYNRNSLVDASFIAGLVLFAFGAIVEARRTDVGVEPVIAETESGIADPSRILLLLIAPVVLVLFKGFNFGEVVFLGGIVFLHKIFSVYVQNYARNESLLKLEIELNNSLEDKISLRTIELKNANKALEILSKQDEVTGLNNRRNFRECLEKMMDACASEDAVVVFYMDLDRFKAINDAYGHDMGDEVLVEVATRLKRWKPSHMLLARLGGDEFVVAFESSENKRQIEELAEEIVEICSAPIIIHPYRFHLSISIGIAQYPMDAIDRNSLMKHADIAMYQAKESDNVKIAFYSSQISDKIKRKHELELLLRKVEYDEEFELYYQPQFKIPERTLIGAEALIRWKNPEKGMISPGEFIPIAEETGRIVAIGEWVLHRAIKQIAKWNGQYGQTLQMGINISPKQLDTLNFLTLLNELIHEHRIRPQWLDIEITESTTMNSEVRMEEILTVLAGVGVSISIDDFGTGYSSLSYLKRFDIDRLKIAKELIDNIALDSDDTQIVKAIVMMARGMGLETIAEGVETEEQLEKLIELQCDAIQGYLLGRPMPAEDFERNFLVGSS